MSHQLLSPSLPIKLNQNHGSLELSYSRVSSRLTPAGFPGAGDGGPALAASLKNPSNIAVTSWGVLFIADTGHHSIRAVDLALGTIATVAGNGVAGYTGDEAAATSASLNRPHGLVVDAAGQIFIADTENHAVRRIEYYGSSKIFTIVGNGTEGYAGDEGIAMQANLSTPTGVLLGALGLYVVDQGNHRIRLL